MTVAENFTEEDLEDLFQLDASQNGGGAPLSNTPAMRPAVVVGKDNPFATCDVTREQCFKTFIAREQTSLQTKIEHATGQTGDAGLPSSSYNDIAGTQISVDSVFAVDNTCQSSFPLVPQNCHAKQLDAVSAGQDTQYTKVSTSAIPLNQSVSHQSPAFAPPVLKKEQRSFPSTSSTTTSQGVTSVVDYKQHSDACSTLSLPTIASSQGLELQPQVTEGEDEGFPATTVWNGKTFPPLRPLSAYNFFFRDERDRILHKIVTGQERSLQETTPRSRRKRLLWDHWGRDRSKRRPHRKVHGMISFRELTIHVADAWKQLTEDQRDFYRDVAEQDKKRFENEMDGRSQSA